MSTGRCLWKSLVCTPARANCKPTHHGFACLNLEDLQRWGFCDTGALENYTLSSGLTHHPTIGSMKSVAGTMTKEENVPTTAEIKINWFVAFKIN